MVGAYLLVCILLAIILELRRLAEGPKRATVVVTVPVYIA